MKFLIQTFNNSIEHDFSFHLIEAIKWNNWFRKEETFTYELTDEVTKKDCIPVGSVEFVSKYLHDYHNKTIKPINIPQELIDIKYTKRVVFNGTEKDLVTKKFVKSNDKIKHFTEITNHAPNGNYQISDLIDIDSEYRCFIYKKKLVGIQNYSGDFTMFPNIQTINDMIKDYKSSPIAYTLDIGINKSDTFIIEVHDFFSCGLYGFSNYNILPYMFSNWFHEFLLK